MENKIYSIKVGDKVIECQNDKVFEYEQPKQLIGDITFNTEFELNPQWITECKMNGEVYDVKIIKSEFIDGEYVNIGLAYK